MLTLYYHGSVVTELFGNSTDRASLAADKLEIMNESDASGQ